MESKEQVAWECLSKINEICKKVYSGTDDFISAVELCYEFTDFNGVTTAYIDSFSDVQQQYYNIVKNLTFIHQCFTYRKYNLLNGKK